MGLDHASSEYERSYPHEPDWHGRDYILALYPHVQKYVLDLGSHWRWHSRSCQFDQLQRLFNLFATRHNRVDVENYASQRFRLTSLGFGGGWLPVQHCRHVFSVVELPQNSSSSQKVL